ncbi:hypothetical protein [Trichothermofontia sp.]
MFLLPRLWVFRWVFQASPQAGWDVSYPYRRSLAATTPINDPIPVSLLTPILAYYPDDPITQLSVVRRLLA